MGRATWADSCCGGQAHRFGAFNRPSLPAVELYWMFHPMRFHTTQSASGASRDHAARTWGFLDRLVRGSPPRRAGRRRGFTLLETGLATMIIGVGVLSVAQLFAKSTA